MLDLKSVYVLQSEYGVRDGRFADSEVGFEEYLAQCRAYIKKNMPAAYKDQGLSAEDKNSMLVVQVTQFVERHPIAVRGYVREDGTADSQLLLDDLINTILGVAVIKDALDDPEVDEIQINDPNTIYVIKGGVPVYYYDKQNRLGKFTSNDEIHTMLTKLIDDNTGSTPQFTDGRPILNAKTAKHQYRVNAVHHSAIARDKEPYNKPISTIVIRKFKETHLTIDDLIKGGSCNVDMGEMLMLLGRAEIKLFCVGPTGSGKTTLLRIIASTIPKQKRLILVQNPTEITFYERDEHGRNTRNVVHWEVDQNATQDDRDSATMPNLITNTLRATPDVILIGEAREPEEFQQIQRAMRTGHKLLGTFHALSAKDGVERFADEIGGDYMAAIRKVSTVINLIVTQYKFENGERKIMEISEVEGVNEDGSPRIRVLYKYNFTGEMEKDSNGRVRVLGEFVHVNPMSSFLKESLYKVGIGKEEISKFCEGAFEEGRAIIYDPEEVAEYANKKTKELMEVKSK